MEKIIWNDSFSVGVAEINKQHQKIIEMINMLIDNKHNFEDSVELAANAIKEMSEYAAAHFKTEEILMKEHNYPELNLQQTQHIGFREEIMKIGSEIVSYGKYVPVEGLEKIITYLCNWWICHILNSDMRYKQFFNEKGIY